MTEADIRSYQKFAPDTSGDNEYGSKQSGESTSLPEVNTTFRRIEIPVSHKVGIGTTVTYREMGRVIEPVARQVEGKFHWNSALSGAETIGNHRPSSAFYSVSPERDKVIVEWAVPDKKGEAKLHKELRVMVDYLGRVRDGWIVRSGHVGQVTVGTEGKKKTINVALLDSISGRDKVTSERDEYLLITTLLNSGIFPVTTDGYPVKIQYGKRMVY